MSRNLKFLPPFRLFCHNNFPFLDDYFDSLTIWEILQKLGSINEDMRKAINELIKIFNDLDIEIEKEVEEKLNEMIEDGTLAEIITEDVINKLNKKLDENFVSDIFMDIRSDNYKASRVELYNNIFRDYPQGMCVIDDKTVIFGLINTDFAVYDNYVKVVEYNYVDNIIVREKYLQLHHFNSVTFDKENKLLYVALNSSAINGVRVDNNSIAIVDYDTLTILDIFTPANLPLEYRVRNVYYNNEEKKLFAGDIYRWYEIDLETKQIKEFHQLETSQAKLLGQNLVQTIKIKGDYVYTIAVSNISIFNRKTGELIKIINTKNVVGGISLQEYEDFDFLSNGDIIILNTYMINELNYRNVVFLKTNLYKNTNRVVVDRPTSALANNSQVYCDAKYTGLEENGYEATPFKTISKALNFIKNSNQNYNLVVKSGVYEENTTVQGCSFSRMRIVGDVTINNFYVNNCNFKIEIIDENSKLTVNGLSIDTSNIFINSKNKESLIFNKGNRFNHTIQANQMSILRINQSTVNADNCNCINIGSGSSIYLNDTDLLNYENHYAIRLSNNSIAYTAGITWGVPDSDTQHSVNAESGSVHFRSKDLTKNRYIGSSTGKFFPSEMDFDLIGNGYEGNISDKININGLTSLYNYIKLNIKVVTIQSHKTFIIPLRSGNYNFDCFWCNSNIKCEGVIQINVNMDNNTITIGQNRINKLNYSTGTNNFYDYQSDSQAKGGNVPDNDFMKILSASLLIL